MALPAMTISHRCTHPQQRRFRTAAQISDASEHISHRAGARKRLACEAHHRCIWQVGGETGDYPASGPCISTDNPDNLSITRQNRTAFHAQKTLEPFFCD